MNNDNNSNDPAVDSRSQEKSCVSVKNTPVTNTEEDTRQDKQPEAPFYWAEPGVCG